MFTKTFTIERHIEELRAELRTTTDAEEAREIQAELAAMLDLPRRAVRLQAGNSARRKRVVLECPAEAVVVWLERVCPLGPEEP